MAKKPPKIPGCSSCPWGSTKDQRFVEPYSYPNPNIILVAAQPFDQQKLGQLQDVIDELDLRPVFVSAANCRNRYLPDLPVIKECREAYVNPILVQYPSLPIVTLGQEALSSIYGGVRKLDGRDGMRYKARMKDGHLVQHTYAVEDWKFERAEHARVVLASAVREFQYELPNRKYIVSGLPMFDYLAELFAQPAIGLDIEIDVPSDARDRDEQFVYPYEGGRLAYLGLTDGQWSYLMNELHPPDHTTFYASFRELAANYTGIIFGHNIKGDLTFLGAEGIEFPKARIHDTYLWETTLPARSSLSAGLKWLAKSRYGASAYEARVHTEWDRGILSSQMPELIEPYLTLDLLYHWKLFEQQHLGEDHQSSSFQIAMDYLPCVVEMELNGIQVDADSLESKITELEEHSKKLEHNLQSLALQVKDKFLPLAKAQIESKDPSKLAKKQADFEKEFLEKGINVDSPKQMKAFFAALGFPVDATNEGVLAEIADRCLAANILLDVKSTHKKLNTNCYEYRRIIQHPDGDGLIHCHYAVSGAETTRMRCRQPNMQNVEKPLRGLFISRYPGGKLLVSDLAAIEYRIIAHLSQDPKLCRLFLDGIDIHRDAAAHVYGVRPEQVTPEMRKVGKTFNFAGVYGAGPEKLFAVAGKEDWKLYRKVQNLYPGVGRWKERLLDELHRTHCVSNCFGQWWEFDGVINPAIEREAVNRVVQSAGHSVLVVYRLAVQDAYKKLVWHRGYPLMVQEGHDAFIDDVAPKDDAIALAAVERVAKGLNSLVKDAFGVEFLVPLTADVKLLDKWE